MSPATTLPSEILMKILENYPQSHIDISNFCLVHRTWYPIAQAILFRHCSVRLGEHDAPRFFEALVQYPHIYPLIRSLDFRSLSAALLETFQALGPSSSVSTLLLRSHRIDAEQRNILIRSFPQLERLSLTRSTSLDCFSGLLHLISSFPKLRALNLTDVSCRSNQKEATYPDIGIKPSLRALHCHLGLRVMDDLLGWMMSHSPLPPISSVYLASYNTYEDLPDVVPSFLASLPTLKSAWVSLSTMWDPPPLSFSENPQLETIRLDFDLHGLNPSKWIPFLSTVFLSVSSVLMRTIVVIMRLSGGCAPNFDWAALGRVLSSPIFTNLRTVYITCRNPYVLEEPPYVGDLEDNIREALAHLVVRDILTVRVQV
ncbi:hypothetical protein PLEOSDRAFT_154708 [Pleurotus ostreatus PC15]|uniref:Uncharacterized protein n=2 Tax=Pleurotus TaxID=5320 RepID=A0A067NPY8_PLEO1|nr:hypothetical protein CCMSSC00406_0007604 [Pleurotus cornucopiae]KDQ29989.1 hypothetical protein PLEOSDRAFT_154708 [Pleurotus ostreatus PC15]